MAKQLSSIADYVYNGTSVDELERLRKKLGWTILDARALNNGALRIAVMNGQLECAKWLVYKFDLEAEDARADGNWALQLTVIYNQFECAAWLVFQFELDEDFEKLKIKDIERNEIVQELDRLRCQRMIKAAR